MARRSQAQWRALIEQWEDSGLRCGEFAKQAGVHAATLGWWKWRLNQIAEEPADALIPFVEVGVAVVGDEDVATPPVVLGGFGHRVEVPVGFDGPTLSRVLDVLEARR